MRIFNKNKGIRGSRTAQDRHIRFTYMIKAEAKQRLKILTFWKKYGLEATKEAYGTKERTLYLWQQTLKQGKGQLESLNSGSRAPKNKRKRRYDYRIVEEIKKLRTDHPNLGEKKLYPLLKEYCDSINLPCPKAATIGNIIKDKGGMRLVPQRITGTGRVKPYQRQTALRKPKDIKIKAPGALVALDTVEIIINGTRRYLITVEDIFSRFAFAFATTSHASKAAEDFFLLWQQVFPYQTAFVLTDNGSEFKKHFAARLLELQITHYHTRPRTPKMNAHIERFNRTIQEEFADYHRQLLLEPDRFNAKLMDWLIFYNTKRVHHAFGNKLTPVQYLLQYEASLTVDCKSTLGYTMGLQKYGYPV
jgi:transposase InsO family protein